MPPFSSDRKPNVSDAPPKLLGSYQTPRFRIGGGRRLLGSYQTPYQTESVAGPATDVGRVTALPSSS